MSVAFSIPVPIEALVRHPNELDLKRIARAITARARYRYVTPEVSAVEDGYRIRSACCSRNIDADGGIIDVALIRWDGAAWLLLRRDHAAQAWRQDSRFARLAELFTRLNTDPERLFWQ